MKLQRRRRLSFGKQARIRTRVLLGRQGIARFGLMPNAHDDFTLIVEEEGYTPPPAGNGNGNGNGNGS